MSICLLKVTHTPIILSLLIHWLLLLRQEAILLRGL